MARSADMAAPLDPRMQLQPAPRRSRVWLAVLTIALPLVLVAGGMALEDQAASPRILGPVVALSVLAFAVIDTALRRHRLTLDGARLEVLTTFYRRSLALTELRLAEARVVDVDERPEFRPRLKTNGAHLPGFHSGWFRLGNRDKAFVAIAGGPRVLWLPTTLGYALMLQPLQPQLLLERLRELAATPAGG